MLLGQARARWAITLVVLAAVVGAVVGDSAVADDRGRGLAESIRSLTRSTQWTEVERIRLNVGTHHPQGMALVGDKIFLSTVEIIEPTRKYRRPVGGYDRTPGRGVGHLLVLDRSGRLLKKITLGEGHSYHPGGIDFDGDQLWVPVAEYRPNSAGIIYRVDPETLEAEIAFRVKDHVGGVVRDQSTGLVHGVSWGSRRLYSWSIDGAEQSRADNQDHFLDYQDCAYVDPGRQLCTGVNGLPMPGGGAYELGGFVLRTLADHVIEHQVPLPYFSSARHSITRNPVAIEQSDRGLRLWAAPDDQEEVAGTELIVYEARLG